MIVSSAAAYGALRAYIRADEFKHRAGVVVQPSHYLRIDYVRYAHLVQTFFYALKVIFALVAQKVNGFRRI